MVTTRAEAARLVRRICRLGDLSDFVDTTHAMADRTGLVNAVSRHDTPALYNWLMDSFSFQGISDQIAWGYIETHGNATWDLIEASIETNRCGCPKLGSADSFVRCGYRKANRTCNEPAHLVGCPVPDLPLRKGDLNQLAYSLYYFLRDRCDGDLVGFIDRTLADVDQNGQEDRVVAQRDALIDALSAVHSVSSKLVSMTFAALLIGVEQVRPNWAPVGRAMVAVDSLVHNFLHRTGILAAYGHHHPYGARCYGPTGCSVILDELARRIDARRISTAFPRTFPRLIQVAIWRFCSETKANICNGRQIDDRSACTNTACPVGQACSRIPLRPSALPTLADDNLPPDQLTEDLGQHQSANAIVGTSARRRPAATEPRET